MIISQTPVRISFLGGGTDYPEHFTRHGGATLGTSIDRYIYITVSPLTEFFDHRIRVSYSRTELVKDVDEIQHPSVRECLRFTGISRGIEIAAVSDLPARTGMGSSSSFTVGLLHALHAFKGKLVSREQLAAEAVHVEREMIKERVGVQDQYTCACGGMLHLEFQKDSRIDITPVIISEGRKQALQERLMIFYTGLQRSAHEVLEQQISHTKTGKITPYLAQLQELVSRAIDLLSNGRDLASFGEMLHQGWLLKRQFSDTISNSFIDDAYERARRVGAIGGKLLGAGSGGFLLLYAEPYNQAAVRQALSGMREVKFQFENRGSQLIFYRPH
jgi:D-glycero-alpha-D-manno-heptose-7-phosphate kinase